MILSLRFNFVVEADDSRGYMALKWTLSTVDFSLLAVDITMTIIFITLVVLDFKEKKQLEERR